MNFSSLKFVVLVVVFLLATTANAFAQQQGARFQRLGGWEIHYNTVATTFLQPEIAARYEIPRSRARSLLNIAVLDATEAGKPAVDAQVTAYFLNILGQRSNLDMQRVQEGSAIYFIDDFGHDDDENLRFFIEITVGNETQTLRFNDQFYHSE